MKVEYHWWRCFQLWLSTVLVQYGAYRFGAEWPGQLFAVTFFGCAFLELVGPLVSYPSSDTME